MKTETQISPPSENVEGMSTLSEVASLPSQEGDSEIIQYLVFYR